MTLSFNARVLLLQEGFNARSYHSYYGSRVARTRLGFIANNENDCDTQDSFVGFGTRYAFVANSAGNHASASRNDNGILDIKVIGYIMAR